MKPDSNFHSVWFVARLFLCFTESIQYPYIAANGFPELTLWTRPFYLLIAVSQAFFILDIILHFFLAYRQGEEELEMRIDKIWENYLKGKFLYDLVVTIPFSLLSITVHPSLSQLALIKSIRLGDFLAQMDRVYYMPIIRNYYKNKLDKVLKDVNKRDNINESNNDIVEKIHSQNMASVVIILMELQLLVYISGVVWQIII